MTSPTTRRAPGRLAWAAFAAAVVVHLVGLYLPEVDTPAGLDVPGQDKVAHIVLFGLVMLTGRLAGIPAGWLAGALVLHAVVSELVQQLVLPHRTGDPLDVLADIGGILLGWYLSAIVGRHRSTG
ncbi:MAG: VanZ family protein [Actinomycetales bacterium]|nr:VanZ family protein [Actinomycetales bacterium]